MNKDRYTYKVYATAKIYLPARWYTLVELKEIIKIMKEYDKPLAASMQKIKDDL